MACTSMGVSLVLRLRLPLEAPELLPHLTFHAGHPHPWQLLPQLCIFLKIFLSFFQCEDGLSCDSSIRACDAKMSWLSTSQTKVSLTTLFSFFIANGHIRGIRIWLAGLVRRLQRVQGVPSRWFRSYWVVASCRERS